MSQGLCTSALNLPVPVTSFSNKSYTLSSVCESWTVLHVYELLCSLLMTVPHRPGRLVHGPQKAGKQEACGASVHQGTKLWPCNDPDRNQIRTALQRLGNIRFTLDSPKRSLALDQVQCAFVTLLS